MSKTLYIVDFSNLAYRLSSVYNFAQTIVNGVEVDVSLLYGLVRFVRSVPFEDIVVVLDGVPSRTMSLMSSYKGNRSHDDQSECIRVNRTLLVKLLPSLAAHYGKNLSVVCSPGQETDEVISSIVHYTTNNLPPRWELKDKINTIAFSKDPILKKYESLQWSKFDIPKGSKCIISSTDGDFIQLQRFSNVFIDTSISGKEISNTRTSKSTHGLSPIQTILYKAIFGDISDNIPKVHVAKNSKEIIDSFISSCVTEDDLRAKLAQVRSSLVPWLLDKREFLKNFDVAFLTFMSIPFVLSHSEDVVAICKKYKVRL